jgi:hypothetical protein
VLDVSAPSTGVRSCDAPIRQARGDDGTSHGRVLHVTRPPWISPPRRGPDQRRLPCRALRSPQTPPRPRESPRRRQTLDHLHLLAHPLHRRTLQRPRRRLLPQTRPREDHQTPHRPTPSPQAPRHPARRARGSLNSIFLSDWPTMEHARPAEHRFGTQTRAGARLRNSLVRSSDSHEASTIGWVSQLETNRNHGGHRRERGRARVRLRCDLRATSRHLAIITSRTGLST